jgi:precorrin-3B C17-methyltransferase
LGQVRIMKRGKLLIVGFGPGDFAHITERAREAIQESDVIIGYNTYVDLIRGLLTDQEIVRTGMTEEVSRAQEAVRQAEMGKTVAVISSGDAGVYGMAGLIYEVLIEKGWKEEEGVSVEVIPGISAINSCASLLGAPVMHDACTISLSDHLTPWELIAHRIEAAASADFVIALYNPRSGRRTRQIVEAQRILLKYRSKDTPVGIVKSAYRERQKVVITTLDRMLEHEIGMLTTVIIGNSSTFIYDGKMITPRGYQRKYTLGESHQRLKPGDRLRPENEPWALHDETNDKTNDIPATNQVSAPPSPLELAEEALLLLGKASQSPEAVSQSFPKAVFEVALSPGVANKKFTSAQMRYLADLVEDDGELEYTPNHYIILRKPTTDPSQMIERLRANGFLLNPVGAVVNVKACDFCDGEKTEALPYAETLAKKLSGLAVPKELHIAINGCGMACYGAALEDIGILYRRGKFDLMLGGKRTGRNAHAAEMAAEGIEPERIIETIEAIVAAYKEKAFPNEAFHKFFKRIGNIEGFVYKEEQKAFAIDSVCGD